MGSIELADVVYVTISSKVFQILVTVITVDRNSFDICYSSKKNRAKSCYGSCYGLLQY